MRRLYVMLPGVESCTAVVEELKAEGYPEHHLHVIGSLSQKLDGLPEATVWQKTELAHGIEWGIGLGGVAGLLGGLLAVSFPPAGLVLGGGAIFAGTAAGAGFGALVSALLASHEHNHKLDEFEHAIEAGHLMLMVDVPRDQVSAVEDLIRSHHPEAEIGLAKATRKSR